MPQGNHLPGRFFLTAGGLVLRSPSKLEERRRGEGGGGWGWRGVLAFIIVLFIGAQLSIPAWGATSLQILSPAGGENIGRWFSVKWMASDPVGFPLKPVSIYYSMDNGNNYQIYQSSTENDGEEWCWLGDKVDTTEAKIKIEIKNINNEITAIDSEKFNIISVPYTNLQSSLPGALAGGSPYEISWHTYDAGDDLTAKPTSIYYSTNNGSSWTTIAADQLPQDKYIWNIPAINAGSVTLKIRAVDKKGNIGEDNWSTSIRADPPVLTLSKPNGGEILTAGQSYAINWKVDNPIGLQNYPFTLYYSPDDGKNYIKIVEGIQKDARSCAWTVPSVNSTKVKIKITMVDVFGQIFLDESDAIFSITIPPIGTVKSPNGGEVLKGGSTFEVTWNPAGEGLNSKDYTINLKYSLNDGEWQSIVQGEGNDGSYIWDVPAIDSSKVKLKVEVVNNAKEVIASDQSDSFFTIDSTPSQIVLSYPKNDSTWKIGLEGLRIAFQATDNVGFPSNGINIYYSGNGGSSYSWVSTCPTNSDGHWWINGATDTNNAKVKIEASDKAGWVTTVESGIFSAVTFPKVSVYSPKGWESAWKGGTIQNITWSAQDQGNDLIANPITIKYSINEGASWQIIASGEANDGSYSWNVPELDVTSWKGKIKIEAIDDDGHVGYSESNLTIDSTPPTAKLTSPNGGEKLYAGQNYYIKWEASDAVGISSLSLFYSTDGGVNYSPITQMGYSPGSFYWTVPQVNSDTVKVKVVACDYVGNAATDESDAVFKIAVPPFGVVLSPNGGEKFYGGWVDIKWQKIGEGIVPADYTINLNYQVDDGAWQTIATKEANDGSFTWLLPDVSSQKVKIKVEAVKDGKTAASDESDTYFAINSYGGFPGITIKFPANGEVVNAGSIYRISWGAAPGYNLSDDALYQIYLTYTFDNALFFVPITSEVQSVNKTFDWKIPAGINTSAAIIEVYTWNKEYFAGQSQMFSIASPVPQPIIKEVIVVVTKEANVIYNPAGKEELIFPKDSIHGLEWVNFEYVDFPASPTRGAKGAEKALKISGNLVELPVSAEVFLPVPEGVPNPKVFRWDDGKKKWISVHSIQIGNRLLFTSNQLGVFAIFDVVDTQNPIISNIKANGRLVNLGDSISDRPEISVEISDDYGLDSSAMAMSVDGQSAKSLQSPGVQAFDVKASGGGVVTSGVLRYVERNPLALGEHTFTIIASDEVGNSSTFSETLYVIGSAVSGLMVYPNPYTIGGTLKFDGLSGDVNVYIYDAAADLVWKGFTSGAASISWGGKNHAGNTVAPGVYFYVVKDALGNKTTGKIAVIK